MLRTLIDHLFLGFCFVLCLSVASIAQQRPVISGPVDSSSRAIISGSKYPLAQPQFDAGEMDPGTRFDRMLLVLGSSQQQEKDLQDFLVSQQDKTSPNYHHWLTPEQFGQKFGPAPQDIATVKAWLAQQGFTVNSVARSGRWIEFSGTSGQAERAFDTLMRYYNTGQGSHVANATEISVPAAMAPVVRGVVSLHNFFKKPMLTRYLLAKSNLDGTYTSISPDATFTGGVHALTPGDYASIYDLSSLYAATPTPLNGTGTTIAIVARSDANPTDFLEFRQLTGLPPKAVSNTVTLPPDPGFDPNNGDSIEVDLDSQWAGAVAPGASINVVVSASTATSDGVDLSSAYIVDHDLAPVMSVSFGDCESDMGAAGNAFYNALWQQAAAQGISVMVASGDSGAAGCDAIVQSTAAVGGLAVSGVSSTPFNTAVGGTEFQENGSNATFWSTTNSSTGVSVNGYIPEGVWNESCDPTALNSPCAGKEFILASGAGGRSAVYSKPAWQTGVAGIPSDAARDLPDVSLSAAAHDGYVICFNLSCLNQQVAIVGGTSASAPSFGGIMAIVNQVAGRQGLANYKLYQLAQQPGVFCNSSTRTAPAVPAPANCIFNDVTTGNNSVPGLQGFNASTGFDLATGLGSVNAANLVNAWKAISLLSTTIAISSNGGTTITGTHGQPIPLSVTVTGSPTGNPSGNVALSSSIGGPFGAVGILPGTANTGTFNGTISNLPGGTYNLTAHYPGDVQFAASDSNSLAVTISPEPSSTTVQAFTTNSAGAPIFATTFAYGAFMDLHANVAAASQQGVPKGSVNFLAEAQGIGTATVNLKGESELLLLGSTFPANLPPGTHSLTANYLGDGSFNASTSAPLTITITKGNATVDMTGTDPIPVALANETVEAFVKPIGNIPPTGTVQFFDAGTSLGTATLGPGFGNSPVRAAISTIFTAEGPHSLTAAYSGDTTYTPTATAAFPVTVLPPFKFIQPANGPIIGPSQSATVNLSVFSETTPTTFSGSIALTCSTSTPAVTCSVNPASVTFSPTAEVPFVLTINTSASASLHPHGLPGWPWALSGVFAIALIGFGRKSKPAAALLALLMVVGISSCGGGSTSQPSPGPTPQPPTHANIVVTGTSGTHVATTTVVLTILHQ